VRQLPARLTMTDLYTRRRLEQRAIGSADQAEFAAILHNAAVIDAGIYDDRVADALDDFESRDPTVFADWHNRDLQIDSAVGSIHEEILRRRTILGDSYPFAVESNQLSYTPSRSRFYEFCLATCLADNITTGEMVQLPRSFERVAALLLKAYFGEGTEALHTGAPRDTESGVRFKDAMTNLSQRSGEWIWAPESELPAEPTVTGDEGLDFVVWKDALDERRGHLFILAQCACGNDWETKLQELDLERLSKWFKPLSYVTPVRAFVTPHQLSRGHMREAQRLAGLVFDRIRLTLIAERAAPAPDVASWMERLAHLSAMVLERPAQ
jgi:hypothetical protein